MGAVASALLAVACVVVGVVVGFILLAAFPPGMFIVVQLVLLALGIATLIAARSGGSILAIASVFVVSAIALPFFSDLAVVGLPECGAVSPGLACLTDATRVRIEFGLDVLVLGVSLAAVVMLAVRSARQLADATRES